MSKKEKGTNVDKKNAMPPMPFPAPKAPADSNAQKVMEEQFAEWQRTAADQTRQTLDLIGQLNEVAWQTTQEMCKLNYRFVDRTIQAFKKAVPAEDAPAEKTPAEKTAEVKEEAPAAENAEA